MRSLLAAVVSAALLAGPAQAKNVTPEDATQFKVGESTLADVTAKLGKPSTIEGGSDGVTTASYSTEHLRPKASSFIPVVGLFAGGATGEVSTVKFIFGPDGKLTSYTNSSSAIDCSVHFVATSCSH